VIETIRIESGCPADDAMYLIAFGEQELGEVGSILARDAGNERFGRILVGGVSQRSAPIDAVLRVSKESCYTVDSATQETGIGGEGSERPRIERIRATAIGLS
jgi:hypothetical protein